MVTDILRGLNCRVWVDDVFCFAETEEALVALLDEILGRLDSVRLFVAAQKSTFLTREGWLCFHS
ncbi:unnamed protein product [Sphacelaria rigidula]